MSEHEPDSPETETPASKTALTAREQRDAVRNRYASIAQPDSAGCCGDSSEKNADSDTSSAAECCSDEATALQSEQLGYLPEELAAVASGANLDLGCGNPTALARLEPSETVLDLGSGGGFDCFLAAQEVGSGGRVIGVDMTPEMVELARENTENNEADNVEFRLGEIEHLPVGDESVDAIISNCVVNLSPDKPRVFEEAARVLRPGGRLTISDVVMTADVPNEFRADPESVASCVAGAATIPDIETMLGNAGFDEVQIEPKDESHEFIREWSSEYDLEDYIVSATIEGRKPRAE